ncbi:MAG: DNA adenine methylase [Candidatus Poribacteria bacterium]|nr:DNA adenine methylase [Candidatus Poribacteria bacterium]
MNEDWANIQQSEFFVKNKLANLKIIPYIGCKAGFKDIFDKIIPDNLTCRIYDIFGGGGAFSFYACNRFGSHRVIYNDNNPIVVNLIRHVQTAPLRLWELYNEHYNNSSNEYYYQVRNLCLENGVEGAANFLYLAKNAFSGKIRFNSSNKFNSPIRKGSSCPKVELDSLLNLSKTIQDLTIMNEDYKAFACVDNSFLYLDPPYFNNTNGHYNGILDLDEFNQFLRTIELTNKVVLSEQNHPEIFDLPESYTVRSITLMRSLQYFTQNKSKEMIAFNY